MPAARASTPRTAGLGVTDPAAEVLAKPSTAVWGPTHGRPATGPDHGRQPSQRDMRWPQGSLESPRLSQTP